MAPSSGLQLPPPGDQEASEHGTWGLPRNLASAKPMRTICAARRAVPCRLLPHKRHTKLFALTVLLKPVLEAKRIVQLESLKNIQPPAQDDFPPGIRCNVTVMLSAGGVICPGELNTHPSAGICNLLQTFGLSITV